mmetsp:Transcript_27103/g.42554  ORF Transcript_27103/g.42554 Transcript_27103/m.42554 type:complete len:472 (-) Transcript_27103:74-1489(-)
MRHRTGHDQHFQPQLSYNGYGQGGEEPSRRARMRKRRPRIELNHGIIATAGCCFFLGCVVSTIVLLCFLRRPHDVHSPFWQRKVDLAQHLKRQQQYQQGHIGSANERPDEKCPTYGCPIHPIEMSNLNGTSKNLIVSKSHIMLTQMSNRESQVNQDRIVMIPSFTVENAKIDDSNNFFIGLFDGHDDKGHEIASYAAKEIPAQIASKLQHLDKSPTPNEMTQIITNTFRNVDANAPPIAGGCTAMTVLRIHNDIYLANTGDSTQFIAIYHPPPKLVEEKSSHNERYIQNMTRPSSVQLHLQGSISIHHQNKLHKANFPEEKSRIENLGGRIHIPPKHPMGSRVIARSSTHNEDVGLAMSRSIGDWEWTAIGVIPDPDVQVINLEKFWNTNNISAKDSKVFVVLGSDGLFDARKAEFVAKHLAYGFFESPKSDGDVSEQMLTVGKKLVNWASPIEAKFYRDDISFVAKIVEL